MARGVGFKYAATRGGGWGGFGGVRSKRRKSQRKSSNCVQHYPEECHCVPLLLFLIPHDFLRLAFSLPEWSQRPCDEGSDCRDIFVHFLQPRNYDFSRGHFKCLPPTWTSIILPCVRGFFVCVCACVATLTFVILYFCTSHAPPPSISLAAAKMAAADKEPVGH